MKKYVLDTNVVLSDPNAIIAFDGAHVILPFKVLEELDSIKSRKVDISRDARVAIRNISSIIEEATHEEISETGVDISAKYPTVQEGTKLFVLTIEELIAIHNMNTDGEVDPKIKTLQSSTVPDDEIILTAKLTDSVLVTRDINMRIKALAYGVEVQDYRHDIAIKDSDLIHTGNHHLDIDDFWNEVGDVVYTTQEGSKLIHMIPEENVKHILPEFLCVGDYLYDNGQNLFVFEGYGSVLDHDDDREMLCFMDVGKEKAMARKVWDLKARNIQQAMAINAIMDRDVHIVVLLGSAGTGKTLITIATALELVMEKRKYSRIIFSKTLDSQFEDIGFLPGTEEQKLVPQSGAAIDALEYLHKDDRDPQGSINEIMDRGVLQFKALTFMRGRSFSDSIIIYDEIQNSTSAQVTTLLSRCGENSKVIMMGNLSQIDNKFITPTNSGLTYATEKLKDWEGCRIIELEGVVRSPLADFVEKNF